MSCNLSLSESLLLWRALAFSACTYFLDPLSLGRLRGYEGSGTFAAGGAETGLGSVASWQLASVWQYATAGLSSCPFDSSSWDGLAGLWYLRARC